MDRWSRRHRLCLSQGRFSPSHHVRWPSRRGSSWESCGRMRRSGLSRGPGPSARRVGPGRGCDGQQLNVGRVIRDEGNAKHTIGAVWARFHNGCWYGEHNPHTNTGRYVGLAYDFQVRGFFLEFGPAFGSKKSRWRRDWVHLRMSTDRWVTSTASERNTWTTMSRNVVKAVAALASAPHRCREAPPPPWSAHRAGAASARRPSRARAHGRRGRVRGSKGRSRRSSAPVRR